MSLRNRNVLYAGNKGFANLGNTCYMNSALQCLSHLLSFHPHHEAFQAECVNLKDCLMKEWFAFQRQMWSNDDGAMINPHKLLTAFQQACAEHDYYFENFQQNDADEFLTLFLDLLHQGIKRPVDIKRSSEIQGTSDSTIRNTIIDKATASWKQHYEKEYSYVVREFSSQLLLVTGCPECNYYTTNHDPIQVISLELPQEAKDLRDCLLSYTGRRYLDADNAWVCDECQASVCPQQRTLLWKTSDVLVILLKRYQRSRGKQRKNERHLTFPDLLDLTDISVETRSLSFALQGVCVHEGSLGGGHYYALCKNHLDSTWYEYNDTRVRPVSEDTLHQVSPYLFFYKRV
jgi:ubiquitin C-terminal hydrolase